MPKLTLLGTSNAVPGEDHENTHLVVAGETRTILVDCVNNQILRLQKAGVDYRRLTDLVLTHFHPDHVSGVPQLLMNMWLMGHQQPLNVHGLKHTLERIEKLMDFYGWKEWPNFFPVSFHYLPDEGLSQVLDCDEMRLLASPVQHMIPTIGLRFEFKHSHKVCAYTCDTEPCASVLALADGADILFHEAAGELLGHSSAAQAGQDARQAKVGTLYLIHYPTLEKGTEKMIREAREHFNGPVFLAEDMSTFEF
jgi:ribonuclease Z